MRRVLRFIDFRTAPAPITDRDEGAAVYIVAAAGNGARREVHSLSIIAYEVAAAV